MSEDQVVAPEQTLPTGTEVSNEAENTSEAHDGTTEVSNETETTSEDKPSKSGLDKRFAKLTKQAAARDQEIEFWKTEALKGRQPVQDQIQDQYQAPQGKPTAAQYGNDIEAYTEALTDWKMDEKFAQQNAQKQQMSTMDTYNSRAAEFAKSTPDFAEVLADSNDIPCAPEIHQALLDSDVGPQMAYHLANNIDELERLNAMTPHRRLLELGKLEDRLTKAPAPKAKVNAPAPVRPVAGPAGEQTKSIYEMSPKELMQHRNAADRKRRG
jgi:signal recognition particle GTPase